MTDDERAAYTALRRAALGDRRLGQTRLIEALGGQIHKRRLRPIYAALERYGLIRCSEWGAVIPRKVIVGDVPPTPDQKTAATLELRAHEVTGDISPGTVARFLEWYAAEWSRSHDGRRYQLAPGKEHGMVRQLLRRCTIAELQEYASYFFKYWSGSHNIAVFARQINEIVAGCIALKRSLV